MRILYLAPAPLPSTAHPGGASTHIREVVAALRRRHEVHLVQGTGGAAEALLKPAPPALRRAAPRALRNLRREWLEWRHDQELFPRALQEARQFRPELVYERAALLHTSGARLARALEVPLVIEQNTPQVEERTAMTGMTLPWLAARLERRCYRAADAVITVSSALGQHLTEKMGVRPGTIHVVPNAAQIELFDPARTDGAAVRRALELPERGAAVVAGFVGVFADWHGLDRLVRAFALAQAAAREALFLLVVGDGPQRGALEALARTLGVAERVRFTGLVPFGTVPEYVAAMDLCVVPQATWYGSPIKLFEYGAMGRPIIAPDWPPIREVMVDGEDGLIVSAGPPEPLATALARLADDPDLRRRLGQRFMERVRAEHNWERVAERLTLICASLLRNEPGSFAHRSPRGAPEGGR